ncbi:MAG TPA: 3'-5' exonuclease, partial [Stenomitos sp.]
APDQPDPLPQIRKVCTAILQARWELPLYQLISFLALELNYDAAELATADKLAARLNQQLSDRATLAATVSALQDIVSTERFDPVELEGDDSQYTRPGQLTLMTMHKAKGLDWDVVFLPFLHESLIPGSLWNPIPARFLGEYAIADVARAQIRASLHGVHPIPVASEAWEQAKTLKTAEELRLLYVAMTRAKRLLWLSAEHNAPFSWGTFNWERQAELSKQGASPIIAALRHRFPGIIAASATTA